MDILDFTGNIIESQIRSYIAVCDSTGIMFYKDTRPIDEVYDELYPDAGDDRPPFEDGDITCAAIEEDNKITIIASTLEIMKRTVIDELNTQVKNLQNLIQKVENLRE